MRAQAIRAVLLVVVAVLSSCSTTTVMLPENAEPRAVSGTSLRLSNLHTDKSGWIRNFAWPVCEASMSITVGTVNAEDDVDAVAEIVFSNQLGDESFSVQFYWSEEQNEIRALTNHNDDEWSDATDVEFGLGDEYSTFLTFLEDKLLLIVHPAADIEKLVDNRHSGYSTAFDVYEYEVAMKPDLVSIAARSMDIIVDDVEFEPCADRSPE